MSVAPTSGFHPLRALALLVGAQTLFALLDATGKSLSRDMGIPLIALVRHAGQALLMVAVLGPRMGRQLFVTRHLTLQVWRGLAMAGFTLFFFTALFRLPQAEATAINFIAPFIVMLLAGRMLAEKVGRVRWTGAAVGFLGMLVLVRPDSHLDKIGVLFALLTVVCNVSFQLLTRRLAQVENSFTTMFISAAISVVISAALLPLQSRWGGWPAALSGQQLLMLATLGVLGAVSQWCLIRAYVWSSASFIAPLLFMQLIWSTATGYLFFQQLPDRYSLLGILVILGSGVATMVFAARSESQH
ncbi:MAG: DMT family transporter [Gammaproteobacteria bacterium]|nr:DMT family transporter [Gammaproteobacteria bacterium]